MPKNVMMEEFQLQILVPNRLTPAESRAIRRVLTSKRFHVALARTLRTFLGRYPSLAKTSIKVAA